MSKINTDRIAPAYIHRLLVDDIFVFGSNLAGRHGAGAAKEALKYGAVYGQGVGMHGRTYAIPTKDKELNILTIDQIALYVEEFIDFASHKKFKRFLVTRIGCGYAGYKDSDIAPLFKKAIDIENINLPIQFWAQL